MQTIYLETSIICHLTDPPSTNPITRACQQLTQLWWHTRCDPSHTFVSDYVYNEIQASDPLRAAQRMRTIHHIAQFPAHERMESVRELLIGGGGLNAKARTAAEHIACATIYNCEILLTWDCLNIANARKLKLLRMLTNDGVDVLPELVTPFELMENSYETLWRDPESKAELDDLRATTILEREQRERRLAESPYAEIMAKNRVPIPPEFDKPLTFQVERLRLLSPWARARILYVMRDQVTP